MPTPQIRLSKLGSLLDKICVCGTAVLISWLGEIIEENACAVDCTLSVRTIIAAG